MSTPHSSERENEINTYFVFFFNCKQLKTKATKQKLKGQTEHNLQSSYENNGQLYSVKNKLRIVSN